MPNNTEKTHPRLHYRYCPRCGHEGTFNSAEMSFKCSQCGFYYFLNSAAAVTALVFNEKNQLLFVRRGIEPGYGMLDLPGGFVDQDESAEQAIMRELEEELEIVPSEICYYGSFPNRYSFSGTIVYTVDLVFKCKLHDLSCLNAKDDIIGWEFRFVDEINPDEITFGSVKNILKNLSDEQKNSGTIA
jgi:NAD+ diphosphatase